MAPTWTNGLSKKTGNNLRLGKCDNNHMEVVLVLGISTKMKFVTVRYHIELVPSRMSGSFKPGRAIADYFARTGIELPEYWSHTIKPYLRKRTGRQLFIKDHAPLVNAMRIRWMEHVDEFIRAPD